MGDYRIVLLFFCLVWVTTGTSGSQEVRGERLEVRGIERILATGRSMEPVWYAGDWIVVDGRWKLGDRDFPLKPGDDIVFDLRDGHRIAHRIVRQRGEWLVTRGMNNDREDAFFVHRDRVVGRVLKVEGRGMKAEERIAEIFKPKTEVVKL